MTDKAVRKKTADKPDEETKTGPEKLEGPPVEHGEPRTIAMDMLDIDEARNTREKIDPESQHYQETKASIHQSGLHTPITVSPKKDGRYELVAGYHRSLICRELGFKTIPALVRVHTPEDAFMANLEENIHRKNLRPYEFANACHRAKTVYKFSVEKIAGKVKLSTGYVHNLIRCIERLPPPIKEAWRMQSDLVPIHDYIEISGKETKGDMMERWRELVGGNPGTPPPKKDKVGDKEKKPPKPKNRDALKRFIAEIDNAEGVIVRNEQVDLDADTREIIRACMRWAAGDLKKYPLVLPPDDVGEDDA